MSLVKVAILLLQASVFLVVFSLGLRETWRSATSLLRRPGLLARSLLSVNVVMPVLAALLAALFGLSPPVKIALIFLAVSPVPPTLPRKQLQAGGDADYVHGLLTALSLLAIVVVPLVVEVLGRVLGRDIHVGPLPVAKLMFRAILLPGGLGMLVHARAPAFAEKLSVSLGRLGNILLLAAAVPLMVLAWRPALQLIGQGEILAMIAFTVVAVAVGHWLGGPDPGERRSLALATASHHPGLAMALAAASFPAQRLLVAAAILLYLVVSALVLLPYNAWCRRRQARRSAANPTRPTRAA